MTAMEGVTQGGVVESLSVPSCIRECDGLELKVTSRIWFTSWPLMTCS